ncbi:hypothetical protein KUTeg_018000 [Tegillarca granosa]|uniref:Ig-like domain-containing protein n=1 Tax=Tegillarca granosa TaxID=220873 RepID=A0ABQ9EGK0_TEGGR|nr:hypothetical protein KUTeg_018000 [Tegillarca granosa]
MTVSLLDVTINVIKTTSHKNKIAAGVDDSSNGHIELYFDTSPQNVTVVAGETASLECYVVAKGKHHVVWMSPKNIVLTKDHSRITDDMRISVERQQIKDWHLHIRDVTYKDRGGYSCFINTEPPKVKMVYLDVKDLAQKPTSIWIDISGIPKIKYRDRKMQSEAIQIPLFN